MRGLLGSWIRLKLFPYTEPGSDNYCQVVNMFCKYGVVNMSLVDVTVATKCLDIHLARLVLVGRYIFNLVNTAHVHAVVRPQKAGRTCTFVQRAGRVIF